MATFTIPSQAIPVGTTTLGPFSLTGVRRADLRLTPTVWPTSGTIGTITLAFDDATRADIGPIPGAALASYKGGAPAFGFWHDPPAGQTHQSVTVTIVLSQAVTTGGTLVLSS
jgi:hypothetical protein